MTKSGEVRKMRMRKDQRGFTIVELLIAIAILSIVVMSVCGFILVGSKSYASANSDINVQQEAQLSLNQMSDVLIDTSRRVNYVGYDSDSKPHKALKDAEFTFTPEDKSLIMYNGVLEETPAAAPGGTPSQTVDPGNGNKHYHFYWSKKKETLYYAELDVGFKDVDTAAVFARFPDFDPADPVAAGWVELASHVTNFSVDLTQVEEKRVVQLALTFLDGRKEYVTSNNVTIRNKVGVNDAELDPLNKKKTLSVAARDKGVILEPGESYHFSTPKVTGDNVADRSVTWSLASSGSPSGGTRFTDTANGILQIATDEPAGTINVVITTNAVDSDGNHASCALEVYIKRVTTVSLTKTADDNPDNADGEISPGCTFTISANVAGTRLGETCKGCGDDTSIDNQVSYEGNPLGNPHVWLIHDPSSVPGATTTWKPQLYIDIVESKPDHATFRLDPNAPISDPDNPGHTYTVVIQALSFLSTQDNTHGRHYDNWVPGAITLTMVKGKENAEPYKGELKYGEQQLDESIREGLPTDYSKYVTAIRVVDNSGNAPDRILLHYTIGGGNNYRICPDLFDLDLNGSYTFYMQAIFPIPEDRYVPGHGGTPDSNETIREEYFKNIENKTAAEGYSGTRYRHGKVFYAKLDRPKVTFNYHEVEYTGKNITYDPVNIYKVGNGSGIIGEIKPSRYENIEGNQGMEGMVYSLYEGEGNSQSQWKKLYYYDEKTMSYQGNRSLAGGVADVSPGGNPYMKLNNENERIKVCGNYHIVPGMLYRNKFYDTYEIIGWQGFDFPNLQREERYYELDDSTIHVEVGTNFNLELWSYHDNQFTKGEIYFPAPSEGEFTSYFNRENLGWQDAKKLDWTIKSIKGTDKTTYYVPSAMKCRYVADRKLYELQLFYNYWDSKWNRNVEISAGIFQCEADGKEWKRKDPGMFDSQLESGNMNPQIQCPTVDVDFMFNGNHYKGKMYIPLPSERGFTGKNWNEFGFEKKGEWQTKENIGLKYLPDGQQNTQDIWGLKLKCFYDAATDEFTIQICNSNWDFITAYLCKSNGDSWRSWK